MRRWLLCGGALAVISGLACERPAPEPRPRGTTTSATTSTTTAAGPSAAPGTTSAGAQPVEPVAKPSCVVPLPAEPERPLVKGPDPRCPPDPDGRPALKTAQLYFEPSGASISAEIAARDAHRMRGLMFRTEMAEEEGMLFVFERAKRNRFWMKNTCLPLDMLFVDKKGFIVGIEENVPTLNENSYFVRCASKYVIEVNAGWSRRHGVKPGDRVQLPM